MHIKINSRLSAKTEESSQIVVIFDGECAFCRSSLAWLKQKVDVKSFAFQKIDVSIYGLTQEQCSRSLYTVFGQKTFAGADAIAFLLEKRGNAIASRLLRLCGPIGRLGYRWIASHRNSIIVKAMTWFFDRSNKKAQSDES